MTEKILAFVSANLIERNRAIEKIAQHLGRAGKRVLVLDGDIGWPMLTAAQNSARTSPGFINFILDFLDAPERVKEVLDKNPRAYRIPLAPQIDLLGAGKWDEKYSDRARETNIEEVYRDGVGQAMVRWLRDDYLLKQYDFVLATAPTNLLDPYCGIVCRDLANLVVMDRPSSAGHKGVVEYFFRKVEENHRQLPTESRVTVIFEDYSRPEMAQELCTSLT